MNCNIGGIFKLLGNNGIFVSGSSLIAPSNGPRHTFSRRRKHQVRTHDPQEFAAFQGHAFGHVKRQFIAFRSAYKRQGDTGIAAGGLQDMGVFINFARFFSGFNHRGTDTIFNAGKWIKEFALGVNNAMTSRDKAINAHQRCIANGFGNIGKEPTHK